jgi:PAS domain S-box-containing protein
MEKETSKAQNTESEIVKLKKTVELNEEIIFFTNKNGIISYINPAFTKTYGFEKDEVVGKETPKIIQSGLVDPNYYTEVWKTLLNKREIKNEIVTKAKDGREIEIEETADLLIDEKGEATGFLTIQRNITELKNSGEEFRKLENLAAIGRMYALLSHEIKNPLASIKNYLDILFEADELSEKIKKPLVLVRDEVKHLNKLMKDVLEYSRPIDLISVEIDLNTLIEKVREPLFPILQQKHIKLINKIHEIKIRGDYINLQSVFKNLTENSIDALPIGGEIEIWAVVEKETYSIFVKDDGHGIINKEKIFEPFFSTKANGTGLGLSIVKKILEVHNGDIKLVSSEPGETIFKVIFPINFVYGKNSNN